jgi:LysR family transcriptional activator of nhaA
MINFHHLHYFWAVAHDGNLTHAAHRLRIAPSALSSQIRQLEEQLGVPLFEREGRRLVLTEAGRLALEYADVIFAQGEELVSTLVQGRDAEQPLRVGAVATLSRNFQRSFVRPWIESGGGRLSLTSGGLSELLDRLERHELDVVLANEAAPPSGGRHLRSALLARQPVSLVSKVPVPGFGLPEGLHDAGVVLPGAATGLRAAFDALCARWSVRVRVVAEVDDMAMLRLMALDAAGLVVVPSVVVRDELESGALHEVCRLPELFESFYAITPERRYRHPALEGLLRRDAEDLLEAHAVG